MLIYDAESVWNQSEGEGVEKLVLVAYKTK